ncbi:MAG: hypothetical protein ACI9OJ_005704 [Myxococcota bacterium]|jgi:hypothetical protein
MKNSVWMLVAALCLPMGCGTTTLGESKGGDPALENPALSLPTAFGSVLRRAGAEMVLAPNGISFEGQEVDGLSAGRTPDTPVTQQKFLIEPLLRTLKSRRPQKVTIAAEPSTPYRVLVEAIFTLAYADVHDVQFLVKQPDGSIGAHTLASPRRVAGPQPKYITIIVEPDRLRISRSTTDESTAADYDELPFITGPASACSAVDGWCQTDAAGACMCPDLPGLHDRVVALAETEADYLAIAPHMEYRASGLMRIWSAIACARPKGATASLERFLKTAPSRAGPQTCRPLFARVALSVAE